METILEWLEGQIDSATGFCVPGSAYRVGVLRGYGNAIQADLATEFIRAVMAAALQALVFMDRM
jgi:hypothetical protein